MTLNRIGVLSAGKVAGAVYAAMGLIFGFIFSAFALLGSAIGAASTDSAEPLLGIFFGLGAIIVMPLFYGVLGFLFAMLGAALYNLVAGLVGGLELDLT